MAFSFQAVLSSCHNGKCGDKNLTKTDMFVRLSANRKYLVMPFSVEMKRLSSAMRRKIWKLLALVVCEIFQNDNFVTVKSATIDDIISGENVCTFRY